MKTFFIFTVFIHVYKNYYYYYIIIIIITIIIIIQLYNTVKTEGYKLKIKHYCVEGLKALSQQPDKTNNTQNTVQQQQQQYTPK